MKSNKFSTIFLILILLFTVTISVGCGKENEPAEKDEEKGEVIKKEEEKQEESQKTTKKVKLLKRNGVEWKENTKINSKVGAKKYTVVWGDTLSLIARTWKVNCYTLAKYNHIKNIDRIEVGQVIYNYTVK